ncbi:peroxisome biogenesis factor 10-like [Hermetia illucens]|uniref:peroxisome biogenesis factor 10-like n=1 Tax=Hermetia illucens TaxID=343691 RepID=UPI0018CC4232|nr:peroxisome biogenesis factor 10-like [Hermetia illucens]
MWRLMKKNPKFSTETCVICLDRKETPRDLDCGHSFCEDCINTYIAEFDKKIHAKCPLCRKQIYSTEPIALFQRPSTNCIIIGFFLAAAFFYTYEKGKCIP